MTKAKAKLFHTIERVAAKVEAGDTKGALRTLGFLALRLGRFELHWAKGYKDTPHGRCITVEGVSPQFDTEHLSVPERREKLVWDEEQEARLQDLLRIRRGA